MSCYTSEHSEPSRAFTNLSAPQLSSPELNIGPADDFGELCEAYNLVYREYLSCGYQTPNAAQMRFSVLQLLPFSQTFVARSNSQVIGTGSVVMSSLAGLPSSHIFKDIFRSLEEEGRRVAEATLLACHKTESAAAHITSLKLIPWGISWAVTSGADDWCVVANPKHVRFWHKTLGMEILAESRPCVHVGGHPGVLLRLPLRELLSGEIQPTSRLLAAILENPPVIERGLYRLTPHQAGLLLSVMPEIHDTLTGQQRRALDIHYPGLLRDRYEHGAESMAMSA